MEKQSCTVVMDIGSITRRANCVHKTPEGMANETDYYIPQDNIVYVSGSGCSCQRTNAMDEEEVLFFIPFIGLTLAEAIRFADENGIEMAFDETKPDDISIVLSKSNRSVSCKELLLYVYDSMIEEISQRCDIANVIVGVPAVYNQKQSDVFAQTLREHSACYVCPLQRDVYYETYIRGSYEVEPPAIMVDLGEMHCSIISYKEEHFVEVNPVENMNMMVLSNLIYSQLCSRYSLHMLPKNFVLAAIIKCLPNLFKRNFVNLDISPYTIVVGTSKESQIRVEMSFFNNSVTDFFDRVFSLYGQVNIDGITGTAGFGYAGVIPNVQNRCCDEYGGFWSVENLEDCCLEGLAIYYDEHGEEIPTTVNRPTQSVVDTPNDIIEDPSTLPPPSSMNVNLNTFSITHSIVDEGIVVEKPVPAKDVPLPPPTPDAPVMRDDEPVYPDLEEQQPVRPDIPIVNEGYQPAVPVSHVDEGYQPAVPVSHVNEDYQPTVPVSHMVDDKQVPIDDMGEVANHPAAEFTSEPSSAPISVVDDLQRSTHSILDSMVVDLPTIDSGESHNIVEPLETICPPPTSYPELQPLEPLTSYPELQPPEPLASYPAPAPLDPSYPVIDSFNPPFIESYECGSCITPDVPIEPQPEPQPESKLKPQPEPQPESQPEPQPEPQPERFSDISFTSSSRVSVVIPLNSSSTSSVHTDDVDPFVKEDIFFGNDVLLLEKGTPLPTSVTRTYVPTKMEMRLNLKVYTKEGVIGHCDGVVKNGIKKNMPLDILFEVKSNKTIYYSSGNKVSRRKMHCYVSFNKQTTIQTNN